MPRVRLTPKVRKDVVSLLRSGAFPRVAVEAAGVPWPVFRRWMAKGKKAGRTTAFHEFRAEFIQARAQARARAEIEVYQNAPLNWLKHGPGRERRGYPGWTNPVRPAAVPPRAAASNFLEKPEVQEVFQEVLDELTSHPELRAALAAVVHRKTAPTEPEA